MSDLDKDFTFYLENQSELVEKYHGRFIVIKDQNVIGDYDSEQEAIDKMLDLGHDMGTFLIQHCTDDDNTTSATFHSRVALI